MFSHHTNVPHVHVAARYLRTVARIHLCRWWCCSCCHCFISLLINWHYQVTFSGSCPFVSKPRGLLAINFSNNLQFGKYSKVFVGESSRYQLKLFKSAPFDTMALMPKLMELIVSSKLRMLLALSRRYFC